jgi:hypothetical protein
MYSLHQDYYAASQVIKADRERAARKQRNAEFAEALKGGEAPPRRLRFSFRHLLTRLGGVRLHLRARPPQTQPTCTALAGMNEPMR